MRKPLELTANDRLGILRRLDRGHAWATPDDRRLCLGCGKLIRGWEILVVRSIGGFGTLRLRCPSEGCVAGPLNWVLPNGAGSIEITRAAMANPTGLAAQ